MLLYPEDEGETSTNFSFIEPAQLTAAARPLRPHPDAGELAILASGLLGDARIMGLDGKGRVVAYGQGPGEVRAMGVCPGAKRSVEIVNTQSIWGRSSPYEFSAGVRQLPSLRVIREVALPGFRADSAQVREIKCLDADGRRLAISMSERESLQTVASLLFIDGQKVQAVWNGQSEASAFSPSDNVAYLASLKQKALLKINLSTGKSTRIVGLRDPINHLSVSPDERWAVLTSRSMRITRVDLRSRASRTLDFEGRGFAGQPVWVTGKILFVPGSPARFLTSDLESLRIVRGWGMGQSTVYRGSVYSTGGSAYGENALGFIKTVGAKGPGPHAVAEFTEVFPSRLMGISARDEPRSLGVGVTAGLLGLGVLTLLMIFTQRRRNRAIAQDGTSTSMLGGEPPMLSKEPTENRAEA